MKFLNNIEVGATPNFTLPLSDGSNGQVLQTNGSGTVTWGTISGGANDYVTAAAFNTSTGVISLTIQNQTAVTVDIDGRFQQLGDAYNSWILNGAEITEGTSVELPISYSSGDGTSGSPAIYVSSLSANAPLTFVASTNTISLNSDLRNSVTHAGSDDDYNRYDIKGRLSSYVSSTSTSGGTTSEQMRLVHNDAHFAGDVTAFSSTLSDKRLKDDVKTIENASEKVSQLRGVEYTWNKGSRLGKREIGLIAQEVESVIPSIVKEKEMHLLDGETYKTVDYEKLVALLIESNKEQQDIIAQLEERVIDLENRL